MILSEGPQKLYSEAPLIGCSFRLLSEAPLMKLLSEAPLWIYCKGLIRRNIWTSLKSLLFWNKQTNQSSTFILLSSAGLSCSDSDLMSVFLLLNICPPPLRCYRSSSSLLSLFLLICCSCLFPLLKKWRNMVKVTERKTSSLSSSSLFSPHFHLDVKWKSSPWTKII